MWYERPVGTGFALSLAGGTMEGPVYLWREPRYPTEAASKAYVDFVAGNIGGPFVSLFGAQMRGPLLLHQDPVSMSEAVTRNYVDRHVARQLLNFLPLDGGRMNGAIILTRDPPSNPDQAVSRRWVDEQLGGADGRWLRLAGGQMQGPLRLITHANPTDDEAATRGFVNQQVLALQTQMETFVENTVGLARYEHIQCDLATEWCIEHNLGVRFVAVQVIDQLGQLTIPDITWVSDTTVLLTFANPCAGTAIIRR